MYGFFYVVFKILIDCKFLLIFVFQQLLYCNFLYCNFDVKFLVRRSTFEMNAILCSFQNIC